MQPMVFLAALVMVSFGVGLGAIPFLNENLRWYIGGFFPVSGALFGLLVAWLGFGVAHQTRTRVAPSGKVLLILFAVLAYAGTYYGNYLTQSVDLKGLQNIPDGHYAIRNLLTFPQFAKSELESLSINGDFGKKGLELEGIGTKVMVGADFLFCLLVSLLVFNYAVFLFPYCLRCSRYKVGSAKRGIFLASDPANLKAVEESVQAKTRSGGYEGFLAFLPELDAAQAPLVEAEKTGPKPKVSAFKFDSGASYPRFMLEVRERHCPDCHEATLWGKIMTKNHKNQWTGTSKAVFQVESQPYQSSQGLESQRPPLSMKS